MKKIIALAVLLTLALAPLAAQKSIYDITVLNMFGKPESMNNYRGKVLLIVNTATQCGFTPQYTELENLYQKYEKEGLVVMDFPCNQFGAQAPGSTEEIHDYCSAEFSISFPMFEKIDVNGPEAAPLFRFLKAKKGFRGFDTTDKMGALLDNMLRQADPNYAKSADIKWNFTKFLVNRKGKVVRRFEPTESIADVEAAIKKLL